VLLGKSLGGGLMPLSAMLTRRATFAEAYGTHDRAEVHFSTWSGNGLACVAGLAALELVDDGLFARAAATGERLARGLGAALEGLPLVKAVRGRGLLLGIELRPDAHPWLSFSGLGLPELEGQPAIGWILCHRLMKSGFITGVCGHAWETVRVQPALTIAADRVEAFIEATRAELVELCRML
jgi:acetylornithine/succinyldiaminopimelate/putrescine aminotransferase